MGRLDEHSFEDESELRKTVSNVWVPRLLIVGLMAGVAGGFAFLGLHSYW